jgi:hypothetical protein
VEKLWMGNGKRWDVKAVRTSFHRLASLAARFAKRFPECTFCGISQIWVFPQRVRAHHHKIVGRRD